MRYSREKIKEIFGIDTESEFSYLEIVDEKRYKTNQQTKLFHSLLMCFWKSGCSSFNSYEDMRNHYKEQAGLLEYVFRNDLKEETRQMLWKAVKLLPLERDELDKVIQLLKGKVLIWHSWSECSKDMASVALNQLINDMFSAGVDSSSKRAKFEEIMKGIKDWYE